MWAKQASQLDVLTSNMGNSDEITVSLVEGDASVETSSFLNIGSFVGQSK